ncbi:RidA family protein [Mesorhizobium sp. B4-1-1]|uniref:RidA family protein n=1 Tax=Mesorhizobium sp. B4-1-1 TaxID=2589890 RepID=UPI0015E38C25|nr:RidA family protein [Mesorhizobium sp. B4-1-1]
MSGTSFVSGSDTATAEERLRREGIVLPPPPAPLGSYEPWVITGSLLMTSGQFSWQDGKLAFVGRVGGEVSSADAYLACRIAAMNAIAQLKAAVGSLDRISRIVRIEGTMQVAPGFQDHPAALNGASDLINTVFGSKGRHSRMIYTNPEMPLNAPVLIVLFAEVEN